VSRASSSFGGIETLFKPATISTASPFRSISKTSLPATPAGSWPCGWFDSAVSSTSIDKVPSGDRWVHEIKFDGYRVQVHLRDAAVKVFSRRGNVWTNRFRKIADDACT
jgi:ATP-dependent DNA ligase